MPATMMHLFAGHALCPAGSDAFMLGCILPDCLDGDRAAKDRVHFRDVPAEKRLDFLVAFGKTLDLSADFDFGVLFHLYLDLLWDNGPQSDHKKAYRGDDWFSDYRAHLSRAGSRAYARSPWAKPLWERLYRASPDLWKSAFALPEDKIYSFLDFNYHWHTEVRLPESEIFTDRLVDTFTEAATGAFLSFLDTYFSPLSNPSAAHILAKTAKGRSL